MSKDYKTFTVTNYRRGTKARWLACFGAMHVVGSYDRGATRDIARQLSISVSQVENLARAGVTRKALHKFGLRSEIVDLLTPSHFARMGKLMRRYEFSPDDAIEYLDMAAEYGMSVEAMSAEIEGANGGKVRRWGEYWEDLIKVSKNLLVAGDAPEFVYRLAKLAVKWQAKRER